jgi:hypothetical protein
MKTKSKHPCTLLVSGGFFLALLLSAAAPIYAEDRPIDRPADRIKEEEIITRNEESMRADTTRDSTRMVGPSGEEIHDFLYPVPEDDKVLTRAN